MVLACAFALGGAGCGGGASAVHVTTDAAADARDAGGAADIDALGEAEASTNDAELDAPADAGEAPDVGVDVEVANDANVDVRVDATVDTNDAPGAIPEPGPDAPVDGAKEAMPDLPIEKASATASWTIGANPMCTAEGAGCMDTGAVGGYQVTASGSCPTASSVQFWFPGGASPLAAGTYGVKPAAGILDVIAMPAGMVGVSADRDGVKFWGRSGAATVTVAGAGRHVVLSNVILKQEGGTAMTSLAADVTCP
ncbi:MAG: hypothetical protein JWM82_789 [Myxococcales bacterium]|nr:hypothetical protein [Myxococcales bacterium]